MRDECAEDIVHGDEAEIIASIVSEKWRLMTLRSANFDRAFPRCMMA